MVVANPYKDVPQEPGKFIREFAETVASDEMVWHRDRKDRVVKIVEGSGWKFQYDNRLPFSISKNDTVYIPAGMYHRLIKGNSKLVVEIVEHEAGSITE